jgi:DNA polymerase III delta prime subunit
MSDEYLWVQKYRPQNIDECILTEHNKKIFKQIVQDGDVPNMLLCGTSGVGKTSVAKALCQQMNIDYMFINASIDRGIDIIRTDIRRFASTISLLGEESKRKMVILDEADQLTNDAQPAFRAFMEEFSSNCGFIFTCNYSNKIIDAIHSRCSVVDFRIGEKEKKQLLTEMVRSASNILKKEGVEFDLKVLVAFVQNYFPDFRRTINELQRYSKYSNCIDEGILSITKDGDYEKLLSYMKNMEYDNIRNWVVENLHADKSKLYSTIYKHLKKNMDSADLAKAVLILGDWQYKSSFAVDQEINLLACITDLMINCEIK